MNMQLLFVVLTIIISTSVAFKFLGFTRVKQTANLANVGTTRSVTDVETPTTLFASVLDADTGIQINKKKKKTIQDYVDNLGGKRSIQRILIANNGMAATKAILSMRQWAYTMFGDERTIEFVAMATRDDLNANAEFVRLADTYVEVPSGSNKNNYANVPLIVDIAVSQKVDAVWPGWGHASENPALPSSLKSNGIQFIGPTAPVMAALGDKVSANILAQTAEVPSIPWSGGGIKSALNEEGVIPKDVFDSACVFTEDEAATKAEEIGYPVMIKASEGGGGKGIRMVKDPADLRTQFIQVQNEVPGSPIFMMQLCSNARHLEVQIVGDEYGNAIALNGRDCSTQRRFQKIFEEGPPSIAPKDKFREMELSAQRLTKSIGYIGAGTVEYLYNAETNKYYFLELNPRLQVEHPVTEGLTGVNLPSVQLQVAMGIPLSRIPQIREFYGKNPEGTSDIDFLDEEYPYPNNHVIAARITAENPDEGFKPTSGKIERVKFQSTNKVWGYFSVGANGGIHEFADSQFGHLFATGATREDARKSLVLALKEIDVRGDIRTTVEYLIKLLETDKFKENTIDTSWLDGIIREKSVSVLVDPETVALSAAVYRAHSVTKTLFSEFTETLAKGQTSIQSISSILNFPIEITYDDIKYSFIMKLLGPNYYSISINGQEIQVKVREQPDNSLLCNVAGESYQLFGQEEALGLRMKINGNTVMIPTVYNPSELRSDVTGKIVRYLQQDRDYVEKDEPYVEVEAMKMIMAIKATESGNIRHNLSPGSILSAGDLIASLDLKDPSKVKQISTFKDRLGAIPVESKPNAEEAAEIIMLSVDGYEHDVESAVTTFFDVSNADEIETLLSAVFDKFVSIESIFKGLEEADVIGSLAKANKDDLISIIPTLLARKQLNFRGIVVLSLLRQLEFMPERFPGYSLNFENMSEGLRNALTDLSELEGSVYGPISLKAKQILDNAKMPAFQDRLDSLKADILAPNVDLVALSKRPNIAVSVNLLVVLMSDVTVSKAAAEVYIRRVYRAHTIKYLEIDDTNGIKAKWTFTLRDLDNTATNSQPRMGFMTLIPNFNDIDNSLPLIMNQASQFLKKSSNFKEPINVLHIGFSQCPSMEEDAISKIMEDSLKPFHSQLKDMDVRMLNMMTVNAAEPSRTRIQYFNFYHETAFLEDDISRNMRPTMPQHFELNRLSVNHDLIRLATVGRNAQLYLGKEKGMDKFQSQALFLRSISLSEESVTTFGADRMMQTALDELERAILDPRVTSTTSSRLFVNVLPDIDIAAEVIVTDYKKIIDSLIAKYATRLLNLRVDEIEVKLHVRETDAVDSGYISLRLIASSFTGGWLTREAYREYIDPVTGQSLQYCSLMDDSNLCIIDPYPTSTVLQKKRSVARRVGSTYATDFLGLIEVALINSWQKYLEASNQLSQSPPASLFTFDELVLENDKLVKKKRYPGENKVGMLAWHTMMKTPQYPEGREVIFIANDVTVQSGSFGVQEDEFFYKASEYARERGLPRIFLSCNSGARIGLVDELKPKIKAAWKDKTNPLLGFEYLYLTKEDFDSLAAGTVDATKLEVNGETQYKLDAIIGQIHGIGVENLRGSGLIAGETSRAYDETFTLSYVTGRSVGIGAYLNRLGQRVIQMQQGPMILTGFSALNKLLGKEVYTSQDQLGGPQIMYPNGVTHEVVQNDRDGMNSIIDWLSYTPKDFYSTCPVLPHTENIDPPERLIEFIPSKTPYDPRHMLGGTTLPDGSYISGFFDKGSFKEYLGGWGKSVVTGRARLGGINVGVIAVETRLVEQRIPADPGNSESREAIQPQAGQVWYPDSAFKTAQAIEDFNRGENLPLIIFANWRGFSGGTRDMYGEILKYGAMIVDALRGYKHPVFVYIPPSGELRGGAWVVIDPTINPDKMEMFADKESRGGILEPPGICEVKFRQHDQKSTMHRLDNLLVELDESIGDAFDDEEKEKITTEIASREKTLAPLYTQIAHEFADLHDRAGRMKAKGCINEILDWQSSRGFFYWRILRRQKEDALKEKLVNVSKGKLTASEAGSMVKDIVTSAVYDQGDKAILNWLENNDAAVDALVNKVSIKYSSEAIADLLKGLTAEEKDTILKNL